MIYIVNGDPIPLARARYGSGRVYDAQKQLKLLWALALRDQHDELPLFKGPLELDVTFYFNYPKSTGNRYIKQNIIHHHTKPDLSNLLKFIEDVAQGVLFKDDYLISSVKAQKLYDHTQPRTEFTIRELYG